MMKRLSKEDFTERTKALLIARKVFVDSGVTNNISIAFEIYLELLSQEAIPLTITSHDGERPLKLMDDFKRPSCPDCGMDLMFRKVPENPEGIKTQLVCENSDCDTVLDSENDLNWWMNNLERKEES